MAPRTNGDADKTGVDILQDRPPDDAFFDTLQREMASDPVAQAHIEDGPIVTLNITAMLERWGEDCIEVYFPEPHRDVQKLTAAAADRLGRGLDVAKQVAGHHRSLQGAET